MRKDDLAALSAYVADDGADVYAVADVGVGDQLPAHPVRVVVMVRKVPVHRQNGSQNLFEVHRRAKADAAEGGGGVRVSYSGAHIPASDETRRNAA